MDDDQGGPQGAVSSHGLVEVQGQLPRAQAIRTVRAVREALAVDDAEGWPYVQETPRHADQPEEEEPLRHAERPEGEARGCHDVPGDHN